MEGSEMDDFDGPHVYSGRLMIGAAIMALGVVSLLARLNIFSPRIFALYVPLFLIVFGMIRIIWPSRPGRQAGGLWIALAGGLLLFDQLDIMKLNESWPIIVIMAGLTLVFKALGWLPDRRRWREDRRNGREVGL
jgi:hypothetical protein